MSVRYDIQASLKRERDTLGRFIKMLDSAPYRVFVEEVTRANEEAKLETPIKTGRLRDGSRIFLDVSTGKTTPTIRGVAVAVDPSSGFDYATYQHNNVWLNHPNGGNALFIKNPFERMVSRIDRRMQEELNRDWRSK